MSFHPLQFCPGCGKSIRAGNLVEILKRVFELNCDCGLIVVICPGGIKPDLSGVLTNAERS
jgi:hypothetical protein